MKDYILKILESFEKGQITKEDALRELSILQFEDIEYARVDHNRELRRNFPEVIFGLGKRKGEILEIAKRIIQKTGKVLITRIDLETYDFLKKEIKDLNFNERGRIAWKGGGEKIEGKGKILIITAGTSDIPVAEEAYFTAKWMGNEVDKIYDVGVAGIHRLFAEMERIRSARIIIVIAGMEGALPSVVAGTVNVPVIAVPTSQGYGANFGGLSALLTMLNSCSGGIAVVNIDNGFGAALLATLINRL
ncbi:MAG: nickel pincer cofactor biosynthesis protein LarB [Candidatus Aminicenantia bacterium]